MTVATPDTEKQTLGFQAEVKSLLHLMIHSLYSEKEFFLRELISNACDAYGKLREKSIENPEIYGVVDTNKFELTIDIDKERNCLILRDKGIGMTREEVVTNLGTIAKSGTKDFVDSLAKGNPKDLNLIGQFGVGFYAAFMVAKKVIVKTRAVNEPAEKATCWESTADGNYSLEYITRTEHGTEVILFLREDAKEFLEDMRLRGIITKYSNYLPIKILMKKALPSSETSESDKNSIETIATDAWEIVNNTTALWTLPKTQITEEQYKDFYKSLSFDFADPIIWCHNKVEGNQEYTTLLYIPSQISPFDLFNPEKPRGLKLYVNRVFIMDDAEQFLPRYLRFIKGIVDSNDLPLNVSREILQKNKQVDTIRSAITKRVLDTLLQLAKEQPEKYKQFWKAFGNVLKEGLAEDFTNRETLAKLLRFSSTQCDSIEQTVSLEDYVGRMQTNQDKIFYITAENYAAASHSPNLEIFREKNIEVLLMYDRIDEWLIAHLNEFSGKTLQSVAKDADITAIADEKSKEIKKQNEDEFGPLLKQIKEILNNKVTDVRISQRLTNSPACIINEQNALSNQMQRILQATGQSVPNSKPILEINPQHKLIQRLKDEQDDSQLVEWSHLLLEQSILAEGEQLDDPASFVRRLNNLLT